MELTHDGGTEQAPGAIAAAPAVDWPKGLVPRVFISYRRDLSSDAAQLLHAVLDPELPGQVFMDTTFIGAGADWSEWIEGALRAPELRVVVVIVHKHFWTHPRESDPSADPRLWGKKDEVLRELRTAVERWKSEKDKGFNLIFAPQDEHGTLPTMEEGMPAWTREVLEGVNAVNLVSGCRVTEPVGRKELVKTIVADVDRLSAQSHRNVRTLADVVSLHDSQRRGLRTSLEQKIALEGNREPRTVALTSALMIVDREFDAGRELLRRNSHVFAAATGEARYWRALAAAVLAASELRCERPRRLASLKLARELATTLLDALRVLDAYQVELQQVDPDDDAARRSAQAALSTQAVVAWALHAIVDDYFEGRGISLTSEGGMRQQDYIDGILKWTRDVISRASIDERIKGLIPAPPGAYELEPGARLGGVGAR